MLLRVEPRQEGIKLEQSLLFRLFLAHRLLLGVYHLGLVSDFLLCLFNRLDLKDSAVDDWLAFSHND